MFAADRKKRILDILRAEGRVDVVGLSKRVGASSATVRRYLQELEQVGSLIRTRGGAMAREHAGADLPYLIKAGQQVDEKRRIARRAVELIKDGDTIILDAGSTTMEMARLLNRFEQLTVVTHDLKIALKLAERAGIQVYQVGGQVQTQLYSTVGSQAVEYYRGLHVTMAFVGADAFAPDVGVMARTAERSAIKSAIAGAAEQVVVVADHTKIGQRGLFRSIDTARIDRIITTPGITPALTEQLRARGLCLEVT